MGIRESNRTKARRFAGVWDAGVEECATRLPDWQARLTNRQVLTVPDDACSIGFSHLEPSRHREFERPP